MRRLSVVALLLLVGCQSTLGPAANRQRPGRVDDPLLSIDEQQSRGRSRYSLPEDDFNVGPNTGINRYGSTFPQYRP